MGGKNRGRRTEEVLDKVCRAMPRVGRVRRAERTSMVAGPSGTDGLGGVERERGKPKERRRDQTHRAELVGEVEVVESAKVTGSWPTPAH